jgi:anaerobic magnesium-protoporphyrin IX monomethyl ester cyclase
MRILFIHEYIPQEPLGIMFLSRALKNAGHETRALFLPDKDWVAKLKEFAPQIVAFSYTTGMQELVMNYTRLVKDAIDTFVVHGGPHPTFVPDLIESGPVDAICRGEGEVAFVELANRMEAGEDWLDTRNFWFRAGDSRIVKNEQRPIMTTAEYEAVGAPDRELVYDAAPLYANAHRKVFITMRGCPMDCSFCFHHAWRKKVYNLSKVEYTRRRSVSALIAEVNAVRARYPMRMAHLVDDIFNLRTEWLEEFAARWPKEVGLPFDCILMANMTTEHHIKLLKKAGCIYTRIAFEAANDHMRNQVYKKNTTRKQLLDAARYIKQEGIRLGSLNMIGGPGATIEDEIDTLRLNIEARVDHPLVSLLQPYPMTDVNEMTENMGFATAKWSEFSNRFNRTLPIAYANRHEFESFQKWFPIVVRNPRLEPLMRRAIKVKWLSPLYTVMYLLFTEVLLSEHNARYNEAQELKGFRNSMVADFAKRVLTKGVIRTYESLFGRVAKRMTAALRMGDERISAHID